jgi:hypothetical protein
MNLKHKKVLIFFLTGFLVIQPFSASFLTNTAEATTCADECAYVGQTQTSGDSYRVCGNYDSDCCLEWSQWYNNEPTCADECAYEGQTKCYDSTHKQACGNYDSDCCLEWSSAQSCGSGQTCQNGSCINQQVNDAVTGSLSVSSYSVCLGTSIAVTLNGQDDDGMHRLKLMINDGENSYTHDCYDAESCSKTWNITKSTVGSYKLTAKFFGTKPDGVLEVYSIDDIYIEFRECPVPTVDIKANGSDGPVSISYNTSANLTWTSTNANSCTASGAWSGTKATAGSQSTGNLTSQKTYTITCSGDGGSASDSVTVNVDQNNPPLADAGPDKEIFETESVILEGDGSDPDGDAITYHWTCSEGSLSDPSVERPVFYGPVVSSNTTYTCTLEVTDSHGASDSDSMNILVKEHHCLTLSVSLSADPIFGCKPLNGVDLTASVSGSASGEVTYFFDCTNDGTWEKIISSDNTSYTAANLCNYSSSGTYTAKTRVQREGLSAENTVEITATTCNTPSEVDIKANGSDGPITISYNNSAQLTWISENVDSCYASNDWSGTKATAGSQSTGNLTDSKVYNITCSGPSGAVSDSVIVNIESQSTNPPVADAGPDKEVYENHSVTLNGYGYDPDGGSVDYYWTCSNGSLSSRYSEDPIYYAPSVSSDRYYSCTLEVTDNEGDTDTDTMQVLVKEDNYNDDIPPVADAGPDKEVYENHSVTLNGYGYDPDGGSVDYYWTCSNGSLSSRYSEDPIYYAPSVSSDRYYSCTLEVTDNEGDTDTDTMQVLVKEEEENDMSDISVKKTVKNLTRGDTVWYNSLYAKPGDRLLFRIEIEATGDGEARDIMFKDDFPEELEYEGHLIIDNSSDSRNPSTHAINVGDLSEDDSMIITFEAEVGTKENFNYGRNDLYNEALVYTTNDSDTDSCKIMVTRTGVAGSATDVNTGITNRIIDSIILPLLLAIALVWILRSKIVGLDKWLEARRRDLEEYRAQKKLNKEMARLKI